MDIKAENLHQENGTISFDVKVKDQKFSINLSVPGKYNVYNALASLSVCETMGIDLESACKALSNFSGCLLYTSPSPRDRTRSRMPSSA